VTIDYLAALTADTAGHTSTSEAVLFWILAVLAVSSALMMIIVRQAVHCALMLAVVNGHLQAARVLL